MLQCCNNNNKLIVIATCCLAAVSGFIDDDNLKPLLGPETCDPDAKIRQCASGAICVRLPGCSVGYCQCIANDYKAVDAYQCQRVMKEGDDCNPRTYDPTMPIGAVCNATTRQVQCQVFKEKTADGVCESENELDNLGRVGDRCQIGDDGELPDCFSKGGVVCRIDQEPSSTTTTMSGNTTESGNSTAKLIGICQCRVGEVVQSDGICKQCLFFLNHFLIYFF